MHIKPHYGNFRCQQCSSERSLVFDTEERLLNIVRSLAQCEQDTAH